MKKVKEEDLFKNYIKLSVIFISIALAVFIVTNIYHGYLNEYENRSYIHGIFNEVDAKESENFLLENEDVLLYISSAKIDEAKIFEKEFKDVAVENNLEEHIVFVNLTDFKNKHAFIESFNDKYAYDIKLETLPAFVLLEDGKIVDIHQSKTNNVLKSEDVLRFIEKHDLREVIIK